TTFQLVALGALILGGAAPSQPWVHQVGVFSLWAAAALTLVTGWDYLRVGLKHMD
ncbi:MAG TPA: CDP-diacylglycerol--glycerol-3-phosphate 3-phosphatidyltransferase, partial [Sphingomicrobium sp.]|nr:CDP-diacylglycerol--glycerol-3-phosphate 3-phosphatidyltransferase [Sphingomicrobium sp.]